MDIHKERKEEGMNKEITQEMKKGREEGGRT